MTLTGNNAITLRKLASKVTAEKGIPLKKLHNTVKHMNLPTVVLKKNYTTCVQFHTSCVIFLTQQLVGSYVSQCCVIF